MPWELEISDRLSRWGFAGRSYRPGIYPIAFNDALVKAVENAPPGVTLYEVSEQLREPRFFSSGGGPTGMLELSDLKEGTPHEFKCKVKDCPAAPFGSTEALTAHRKRYHRRQPKRKKKEKKD